MSPKQSTKSSRDHGEIDVEALPKPSARRQRTVDREQAEADAMASDKDFWRKRRTKRVSRTELISYRIFPESRQKMERIALAENISLVEVIEKGIDLYDQLLSGKKADK